MLPFASLLLWGHGLLCLEQRAPAAAVASLALWLSAHAHLPQTVLSVYLALEGLVPAQVSPEQGDAVRCIDTL